MKSSAKKISLTSVDDLFSTEESRVDEQREKIAEIPLSELYPFKDHPFKVIDNAHFFLGMSKTAIARSEGVSKVSARCLFQNLLNEDYAQLRIF